MRTNRATILLLLLVMAVALSPSHSQPNLDDYDFFYLVLQWPGAYCDTRSKCCYPTTGKPAADFGIHGLWPNRYDGSYPASCDSDNLFDSSQIADLRKTLEKEWPTLACPSANGLKFWAHEWNKHGTCSESLLDQHQYFETCLGLKKQADLLNSLSQAGIVPDDGFYALGDIQEAIGQALNVTVGVECNKDLRGNNQLYQIYLCVDNMALGFIDCPILPRKGCPARRIQFPPF